MWLFTSSGFVSAVEDWNNHELLIVRARDEASLAPLSTHTGQAIEHSPDADYPYRARVTKEAFAGWTAHQAAAIDYGNFKSEVAISRGSSWARALGKVWSVMHDVEDPVARTRPTLTPSIPTRPDVNETVRPFTIERVRRPYPATAAVLPDSTAVVAFGNPNTARVATLGINPSYTEFDNANLRRLSTLGVSSPEQMTEHQARDVAVACYRYFQNSTTHNWFKPMQQYVLDPVGASYVDGTACHLDLTPWATKPVWSGVDGDVREQLLADDAAFLRQQIREHTFSAVLVNGLAAVEHFREEIAELEFLTAIPAGPGRSSRIYVGHVGSAAVVGWTLNVPLSWASHAARSELADFLRSWFGNEL